LLPLSFLVFIQVIDKTIGLVGPEVKTLWEKHPKTFCMELA
jgi:hypothetical protein